MATNTFNYQEYVESDAVRDAKAQLDAQLAQKPGAYQSQWQQQMDDILNKIQNREKFSYDLNGDALYQQYKDQYVTQGKLAMMDTMGQAAALTGGYGNSYAQGVGQQAYQGYLQQLNNKVPELYQLALDQYNQEGNNLYNQYALLGDRENTDYGRYRDEVSDYNANLDRLQSQYNAERDYDYSKYSDDRNFQYGAWVDDRNYQYQVDRDKIADEQWQREFDEAMRQWNESFAYQQNRDQISDSQWLQEFEEAQRQYNETLAYNKSKSGGSGGNLYADDQGDDDGKDDNGSSALSDYAEVSNKAEKYAAEGASQAELNQYYKAALSEGKITQEEYKKLKDNVGGNRGYIY